MQRKQLAGLCVTATIAGLWTASVASAQVAMSEGGVVEGGSAELQSVEDIQKLLPKEKAETQRWLKALLAEGTAAAGPDSGAPSRWISLSEEGKLRLLTLPGGTKPKLLLSPDILSLLRLGGLDWDFSVDDVGTGEVPRFGAFRNMQTERTVPPDLGSERKIPPAMQNNPDFFRRPTTIPVAASQCATARNAFFQKVEPRFEKLLAGESIDSASASALLTATRDFDNACLEKVQPGPADQSGLPLDRIAILLDPQLGAFCMGLYLGNGAILTAKHCRYSAITDNGPYVPRSQMRMSLADRSQMNLTVELGAASVEQAIPPAPRDWTILRVPALANVKGTSKLELAPPSLFREGRLVGFFQLAGAIETGSFTNRPNWTTALRATRDVGIRPCQILDFGKAAETDGTGCIIHSCQSLGGFSGAPLFARQTGGQWQLVGVHVAGSTPEAREPCGPFQISDIGLSHGNMAARIPSAVAAMIH